MFRFKCGFCDEWHEGMPTFACHYPQNYLDIPEKERAKRCKATPDYCVIDGLWHFVRGCIEIPVIGEEEPFVWGVWVSLSDKSFKKYMEYFDKPKSSHIGPFFGWLNSSLPYPDTTYNMKTMVYLRDDGKRPFIQLEPTDHPLAIEQYGGITVERVEEIFTMVVHGKANTPMNN